MSEGDDIVRPVFQMKGKRKQGGVGIVSTATTLPANVTEVSPPEPTPPDTSTVTTLPANVTDVAHPEPTPPDTSTATTLPANVTEVAPPEPTPPIATPLVATPLDTTPPDPITPPNLTGGPSKVTTSAVGDLRHAWPKDFFDLQLRPKFVRECMVETTNTRAASEGAGPGGTKYSDYTSFDVPEMYKFIGLFLANGLSPKPSMDLWFLGSM